MRPREGKRDHGKKRGWCGGCPEMSPSDGGGREVVNGGGAR